MKSHFSHKNENLTLEINPLGEGYQIQLGEKTAEVHFVQGMEGQLAFYLDGRKVDAHVSSDEKRRWVTVNGQTWVLEKTSGQARGGAAGASSGKLTAPMPGQVRAVHVAEGENVETGQTLLILEAMKMEIRIQAPIDGVVARLAVREGDIVEREEILAEVQSEA
ncbi:MAG: biotin/lipoyl-binding protein [Anaerolineales bacterium]|nr:biotin/lipoyl-binding protein [Anaerolineales bacterium]